MALTLEVAKGAWEKGLPVEFSQAGKTYLGKIVRVSHPDGEVRFQGSWKTEEIDVRGKPADFSLTTIVYKECPECLRRTGIFSRRCQICGSELREIRRG